MVGRQSIYRLPCPPGTPSYQPMPRSTARIVAEKASVRPGDSSSTADDIVTKGYDGTMDAGQMLDYAERRDIRDIPSPGRRDSTPTSGTCCWKTWPSSTEQHRWTADLPGITTGFSNVWTSMTSGLQRSDLIILAARPAMGKTAFALSLALNAAVKRQSVGDGLQPGDGQGAARPATPLRWSPRSIHAEPRRQARLETPGLG